MTEYDDAYDKAMDEAYSKVAEAAAAWRAKWPLYCRACNGWGGFSHPGTYHQPPDYDPCEALPPEVCHRCGQRGFDEDHNGLKTLDYSVEPDRVIHQRGCLYCEHNDDDGVPEF